MTAGNFRRLALEISEASESTHMRHPDFRIGGKIFATLGYPDDEHGMVKLTPEQQQAFQHKAPGVFASCAGAWRKRGWTTIDLAAANARASLDAASKNISATNKS